MSSKPSFMISTWSSRSSSSTSRSRQRCRLIWFRTPEFSKSSSDPSTTSSRSASAASPTNSSFRCTAVFRRQESVLSATRVMLRKCTSSARASSMYTTTRMTRSRRRSPFSICQSSATLVTTRSCTIWSPTSFSRHYSIVQRIKSKYRVNFCAHFSTFFFVDFASSFYFLT